MVDTDHEHLTEDQQQWKNPNRRSTINHQFGIASMEYTLKINNIFYINTLKITNIIKLSQQIANILIPEIKLVKKTEIIIRGIATILYYHSR